MKIKSIHYMWIIVVPIIIYTSLSSFLGGANSLGATGCGGCHNVQINNTTLWLDGIPNAGYTQGQTYTIAAMVINTSKVAAGFNLICSKGKFIASTNTQLSDSNDITHINSIPIVNDTAKFIFNWLAPATNTSVTFSMAGNAVNGDGLTSGDEWTKAVFISNPTSVISTENNFDVTIFPCPANHLLQINCNTKSMQDQQIQLINASGNIIATQSSNGLQHHYTINTSAYTNGVYFLKIASANILQYKTVLIQHE